MAKKTYYYAELEGVAQEMRANPDMVFYSQGRPVATNSDGKIINLTKEFGDVRTSGPGWPIDEMWIVGAAIGVAGAGAKAIARLPHMTSFYGAEYTFNQAGKLRAMTG